MFKNNNRVIEFIASRDGIYDIFDSPKPSYNFIPKWYKNQSKYVNGKFNIGPNGNPNHTVKACMPVFDAITCGYMVTLPADVYFKKDESGQIGSYWSTNNLICIESHSIEQYSEFKVPDGYYPIAFKFINPWTIKTPKGYSSLFIQPLDRDDLPFQIVSAVVDTDKHPIPVNLPFFLKSDFEGVLEMGTPIAQIIPIKRENWSHKSYEDLSGSLQKLWSSAERKLGNRYKTFFRDIKVWK